MRRMRPYRHAPAKLRVRSESTSWMDLLIHGCIGRRPIQTQLIWRNGLLFNGEAELSRLGSDSLNWMEELAGSILQDREGPSEEIES